MKRLKMTVFRLMIAVAVVAIPLGFGSRTMLARRESYLRHAAYHARREGEEFQTLMSFDRGRREGATNANDRSILKMEQASRLRVPYHAELKQLYQDAAAHPWVSVPPDPKDPGEDLIWESLKFDPNEKFWELSAEDWKKLSR